MTVFYQGQEVYDEIFFPNKKLTISRISYSEEKIEICGEYYDFEGYKLDDETCERLSNAPTLSTKPYSLNGFEQKSKIPTYKMAEEWYMKKYWKKIELEDAMKAVKQLSVLRDYYNNGWVPNFEKYFYISSFFEGGFAVKEPDRVTYEKRFLFFKTKELAEKFLNEQKQLLENAKPLL